jgi:hypothetical protein
MAARVFLLVLRESPPVDVVEPREALRFLISIMHLLKKTRPYTEALIMQLEIDLETLEDSNPTGHIMTVQKVCTALLLRFLVMVYILDSS